MTTAASRRVPMWVKLSYSAFVLVLVPPYWVTYSPWNFLYFCDIALLITAFALWIDSPLLFSMQAVAITAPQMLWVIDLLCRLALGVHVTGVTGYMLDATLPLFVPGHRDLRADPFRAAPCLRGPEDARLPIGGLKLAVHGLHHPERSELPSREARDGRCHESGPSGR
jgi:hypothetical protein